MSEIININEDWQLHSGAEVQAYVKKLLGDLDRGLADKIGWLARVTKTVEGVEKECMLAFATRDDYINWVADPESVTPIIDFELPSGGGGEGTIERYIARLVTNPEADTPSVIIGGSLNVELRFTSLFYSGGQYINAGENGLLTLQRSTDGGATWQTVATSTIRSRESGYDTFDIAPYLVRDRQTIIRANVSFTSRGDDVTSIWVEVAAATYTALKVLNKTDFTRPLVVTNANSYIMQSFAVLGAVEKVLHIEIGGANAYNTNNPAWTYTSEVIPAGTEYPETSPLALQVSQSGVLTHGVHTVKAWVTCEDGAGNELSSDAVIGRFMVVNASTPGVDLYEPKLLLQEVYSPVTNYVHTTLARYAVWVPSPEDPTIPSMEPIAITVKLTNSSQTIEYMSISESPVSGVSYPIDTTIEIESELQTEYAFLYILREGSNFLQSSIGVQRIGIEVDNSEDYAPITGADFVLNPKNRNNSESNPRTIINQQTGAVVEGSVFENFNGTTDLWVTTSDNQKVLRVLAGSRLTIAYEPFREFINDGNASMTLDIDFAVRNITQEDEPMIDVCQIVSGELLGLRMLPLDGYIKCASQQSDASQNFSWEEGVRTHVSIVLNPSVVVKADDELTWQNILPGKVSRPLALAKVYINGVPYREVVYANNQAESAEGRMPAAGTWCRGAGHGGIKIGNPHADIDIYGIRCYRTALSSDNVLQNVIASLPTAAEKQTVKSRNKITANGRISYTLTKAAGYRCLTLVGQDQYKLNQNKEDGYPCYWRIDHDVPELSGTIGKAAYLAYINGTLGEDEKCLVVTPQGSTANTYWDNNEQTKYDGINYKVNIPFSKVHSDFGWMPSKSDGEDCECPMYLNGSRIEGSSYDSLDDALKQLVRIVVQDGWFDGNGWSEFEDDMGMYHGQFYTSYVGGAKCTKGVNKINYASSMQSHKMGATRFYHDVIKLVCGSGKPSMSKARYSVYEECFMFFTEHPDDNGKVEFRGMCTFGDGKFDKAVFGYKSNSSTFAFEGLNNNLPLCDFRVPADERVTYDPDEESWSYAGTKSFEYGLGATEKRDGKKYPTAANDRIFRRYVNFIYCHNTALRYFEGTKAQFDALWNRLVQSDTDEDKATREDMMNYPYWCTGNLCLYRYDFAGGEWTDAGTWDAEADQFYVPGVRNLTTDSMTSAAYTEWLNDPANIGEYDKLNELFRAAIASHGRDHFGLVADVENHKTHYNVVNFMLAGTDNCSKNMYYQYDPETSLIYLDGDDLDSILKTDNNGNQTKVYFLDRIHDVQDYQNGYKPQIDYEGRASALFNFIEAAYEEFSNELRANMRSVLNAMVTLCGGNNASVYGCIEKYFFNIQTYFPEVAWNEQARLRYEWPKSFDYISYGNQARGIDPITQQVGNQLESERQYAKRRIALIASYAAWGGFAGQSANVGLSDSGQTFSMMPGSGRTSDSYLFDAVVPHQWIYPIGVIDRTIVDPHVRVAPNEGYVFNIRSETGIGGDSSASLCASNYYRKFGNVGNMVVGNDVLSVAANRLTEFVAEPRQGSTAFRPGRVALATPNLIKLSLNGCSVIGGSMDLSALTKLAYIDLRGTSITSVTLPKTGTLEELYLPVSLTELVIEDCDNLETVEFDHAAGEAPVISNLTRIVVRNSPNVPSLSVVTAAINSNAPLATVILEGVNWENVAPSALVKLAEVHATLTGRVSLSGSPTLAQKLALVAEYGNVDDPNNALYITGYTPIEIRSISISGERRTPTMGDYQYTLGVNPTTGNNVTGLKWSITENDYATIDENTGLLHVMRQPPYDGNDYAVITCRITVGSGTTPDPATFTVGLFERKAQVGDLVYHDGTFGPLVEKDNGKTVIGVCFYSNDIRDDVTGNIIHHDRRMISMNQLGGPSSYVWGPQNHDSGIRGFSAIEGVGSVYNVPTIDDIYNTNNWTVNRANYWNGEWPEGGFKLADDNGTAQADIGARPTGPTGLLDAPANTYIPVGRLYTLYIIELRNKILNSNIWTSADNVDGQATRAFGDVFIDDPDGTEGLVADTTGRKIPRAVGSRTEFQVFDDLYSKLNAFKDSGGNTQRYGHLLFPAASKCYAYQPSVTGLAEQFKAHNWYLPSAGEMCRIFWHLKGNSNTDGNAPMAGTGAAQLNGDYMWTSNEYNGDYAWALNGSSGVLTYNYNSKYNGRQVRAACAF